MSEIIDLSQEIFAGMPVYKGLPEVKINVHNSQYRKYCLPDYQKS